MCLILVHTVWMQLEAALLRCGLVNSMRCLRRGIKEHTFVHPLDTPGQADLSADIDFDALRCGAKP